MYIYNRVSESEGEITCEAVVDLTTVGSILLVHPLSFFFKSFIFFSTPLFFSPEVQVLVQVLWMEWSTMTDPISTICSPTWSYQLRFLSCACHILIYLLSFGVRVPYLVPWYWYRDLEVLVLLIVSTWSAGTALRIKYYEIVT